MGGWKWGRDNRSERTGLDGKRCEKRENSKSPVNFDIGGDKQSVVGFLNESKLFKSEGGKV